MSSDLPRLPNPISERDLFEQSVPFAAAGLSKRELFDALSDVAEQQRDLGRRWVEEECMLEKMLWIKCKVDAPTLMMGACLKELDVHDMCVRDKTIFINAKRARWINSNLDRLLREREQQQTPK